jgi:MYXO-CTERM domain-containing protein
MKKLAVIALLSLALPASASAKGPSAASLAGPGMATIRISGEEGGATPFWRFVEAAGFFEGAYGSGRRSPPPGGGALGPRYTITWTVPSSSILRQDVYPYAKPSPLTYMPLGQTIYGAPGRGGWFTGGAKLERTPTRIGVPPAPMPVSEASSSKPPIWAFGAALLALAGAARFLRRRSSDVADT